MKTKIQQLSLVALLGAAFTITQHASAQITTFTGAGVDQNWSTPGNWTTSGGSIPPGPADIVQFTANPAPASASAAGTVDSIVDSSRTIGGLQYINTTSSGTFHTTQINDGQTLTLNGTFSAGVAGQATIAGMTGNGNFTVNNPTGSFNIGGSGLATATVTFTLANGTNTINAAFLSMSESGSSNGRNCIMNLGAGPTFINVDTNNLGSGKGQAAILQWTDSSFTNRIVMRNRAGTGRALFLMANGFSASGSPFAQLLFAGHHADILASTITMGKASGSETGNSKATITVDDGIIDATSIIMGDIGIGSAFPNTSASVNPAIINLGGNPNTVATLIVNSPSGPGGGSFLVGASFTNHLANVIVNINTNGLAQIYTPMVKAQSAFPALNTTALNINGGTLNMEAATNTVGTRSYPLDNITLDFATLVFGEDGNSLNMSAVNLTLNDTNVINFLSLPPIIHLPTTIPIIAYTTLNSPLNLGVGTLPGDYQGHISDDGLGTISLVITSGTVVAAKQDEWIGNVNNNWDTSTLNWTNATLSATNYAEADFVTFGDKAVTGNVTLVGNQHTPSGVTVANNTVNYVLSGAGRISGSASLIKSGTGSLTLAETGGDNFSGGITVHGGTVILDNPNSAISGGLTNDIGSTVQIGNNDANGVLPVGNLDIEGTLVFSRSNSVLLTTAITGGGGLTQNGSGTLALNGASTYSGNTTVSSGTLAFGSAGTVASPLIFVKNAALDLSTAVSQSAFNTVVLTNGALKVATNTTVFNFNSLAFTNSSISIDTTVFANPTLTTTALKASGVNTINVTSVQNLTLTPTLPTIIPLITYSSFSGSFNFGLTAPIGISGYISNDVASSTVELVITNAPQTLTWNGGSTTGNNWSDAANWTGTAINPLDALTFDGIVRTNTINNTSAGTIYSGITFNAGVGSFTLSGAPINLAAPVLNNSPIEQTINLGLVLTNNSSATLDGGFSGGTLTMKGGVTNTAATGTVTLTNLNNGTISDLWQSTNGGLLEVQMGNGTWSIVDGTGNGTQVQAGRVQLHVNPIAAGEFDYGTSNSAPNMDLGFSTNGTLVIDGATAGTFAMNNGTLKVNSVTAANGGTQHSLLNVNGGTLIVGSGGFTGGGGSGGASIAITVTNGSVYITNGGPFTLTQRSPATISQSGGLLQLGGLLLASGQTIGGNGIYTLSGGTLSATNISVGRDGANAWGVVNYNGGTLKVGVNSTAFFSQVNFAPLTNVVQGGGAVIDTAGFSTTFNVPFITDPTLGGLQDGGLVKVGAGTLTLSTANTYNGSNTVNAGTLLVNGSVLSDVTVNSAGILGGAGTVGGQVTVTGNGTVAAGTPTATGILTVVSNVTFNATGTNFMKLKKGSLTNDVLSVTDAAGKITFGGTLSLTNMSGTLANNDVFKLYSAASYAGSFARIVPATPGAGLAWNTNNLTVNGTLSITGASSPTTNANILSVKLVGTNLVVHGTNNNGGQNFRYAVLTTTDITNRLSNWTPVITNSFNADGTFDYTSPIVPGSPRQFIDVIAVP